ncbi:MAG: hypothetical protein ACPLZD_00905 [Candidatus Saccharicenans sp.]
MTKGILTLEKIVILALILLPRQDFIKNMGGFTRSSGGSLSPARALYCPLTQD